MSHCYSVGVEMNGKQQDICTLVPGNEELAAHVRDAEAKGTKPRAPTQEEINRAIEHSMSKHSDFDHSYEKREPEEIKIEENNKKELDDMLED